MKEVEVMTNLQYGIIIAVLRITEGKGYLAYLWADSNEIPRPYEIEEYIETFENWAEDCCELSGAHLTEY